MDSCLKTINRLKSVSGVEEKNEFFWKNTYELPGRRMKAGISMLAHAELLWVRGAFS